MTATATRKDPAQGKREASRRCIVKKNAAAEKMTVEEYIIKTYQIKTTLEEYVTDDFHNKLHGKTIPSSKDARHGEVQIYEHRESKGIVNMSYTGKDMTVIEFLTAYYNKPKNSKKIKEMSTACGKKVLGEKVLALNNDCYLAEIMDISAGDIQNFINPNT